MIQGALVVLLLVLAPLCGFAAADPPAAPAPAGHRLAQADSAYLRQHASNPVEWFPWGEEAFARSRQLDRPVFLSIGYAACHWCHVMRRESFADAATAEYLNRHFVSIKVDREQLPHVDDAYMSAVNAMRGSGGWPLNMFLFPDGKPFFGGTYFAPRELPNQPSFRQVLELVVKFWTEDRAKLLTQANAIESALARARAAGLGRDRSEWLDLGLARLAELHDRDHGGIGRAQKFPMPEVAQLFFAVDAARMRPDLQELGTAALRAMARGGLRDAVGGGFHRYCVDRAWTVPHFEKMLYNQCLIADAYLDAYRHYGDLESAQLARETLDALLRDFGLTGGGFAGSWDADVGEDEGTFYLWTPAQVEAALADPTRAAWVCRALGITARGNVEGGRSVPARRVTLEALAQELSRDGAELQRDFAAAIETLRAARAVRPAPLRDEKVILGWNAMAVATLARAATLLGEPRYLAAAERTHGYLNRELAPEGQFLRSTAFGSAGHPAQLADAALLLQACLELYQANFDPEHVVRAQALFERVEALFGPRPETGARLYFDSQASVELFVPRSSVARDGAEPAGNAVLARALLRLAAITGSAAYRTKAEQIVAAGIAQLEATPHAGPTLALAALETLLGTMEVVIAGARDAPATFAFLEAARRSRHPATVVAFRAIDPWSERDAQIVPILAERTAIDGKTTAYVCRGGTCRAPVTDLDSLRRELETGWKAAP